MSRAAVGASSSTASTILVAVPCTARSTTTKPPLAAWHGQHAVSPKPRYFESLHPHPVHVPAGSVMASFTIEDFGNERLRSLNHGRDRDPDARLQTDDAL